MPGIPFAVLSRTPLFELLIDAVSEHGQQALAGLNDLFELEWHEPDLQQYWPASESKVGHPEFHKPGMFKTVGSGARFGNWTVQYLIPAALTAAWRSASNTQRRGWKQEIMNGHNTSWKWLWRKGLESGIAKITR